MSYTPMTWCANCRHFGKRLNAIVSLCNLHNRHMDQTQTCNQFEYKEMLGLPPTVVTKPSKVRQKKLATWECVVTEVEKDIVFCDAHVLDETNYVEFWELELKGHKFVEGDAFYVLHSVVAK